MTVICTDGKTIAADSLALSGGGMRAQVRKLFEYPGVVVGVSGTAGGMREVADWYGLHRCDPTKKPSIQESEEHFCKALALHKDGTVMLIEQHGAFEVEGKVIAIGSGDDIARTAMHLGEPPSGAVALACELTAYCGLPVVAYDLEAIPDEEPPEAGPGLSIE